MSQNRRSDNDQPHRSDSEEEEGSSEESEDLEGSESETEEEQQEQEKISLSKPQVIKKPSVAKKPESIQTSSKPQSSSSTEESGSESESDSPPEKPRKADANIKPIASKPMDELNTPTKKPRSKPNIAPSFQPPVTSAAGAKKQPVSKVSTAATVKSVTGAKRAAENEGKESKRVKKKVDADNVDSEKKTPASTSDDSKKQLFQRLWSEDDEIVILKGIMDYTAKTGADPTTDMNAFHGLIKKSLHVDVTKAQLLAKVRRLKKKYENNASKVKNGKERTFSKAHEQKAYDLSKKIWGSEKNGASLDNSNSKANSKPNGIAKSRLSIIVREPASPKIDVVPVADGMNEATNMEVEATVGRKVQFGKNIGNLSLEEEIIRDGIELISGPKRVEMEEKWRKLRVQEMEVYLKRIELISEQAKLVLEALK